MTARMELDVLDARYSELRRRAALGSWDEATTGKKLDRQALEAEQERFLGDPALGRQLAAIAERGEPDVRERVRQWLEHCELAIIGLQPRVRELREHIRRQLSDTTVQSNAEPLWTLYGSEDAAARRAALASLSERTLHTAPWLEERAALLQNAAARAGARSFAELLGYPGTLAELERVCASQRLSTQRGWELFLQHARERQPDGVGLADYLALATRHNGTAGACLKSAELPRLARAALQRLGFDLDQLGIQIVCSTQRPGGSAYGIQIPDDVRFTGHFPDGFEGARGYFHELGHAVHMKSIRAPFLPARMLPGNAALTEGAAEIFTLPLRDRAWLGSQLEGVTAGELDRLERATLAFEAIAVRYHCLHACIELGLFEGYKFGAAFQRALEHTFPGTEAPPVYVLTPYLGDALGSFGYVYAREVQLEFLRRLGPRPLLSSEAGSFLRETLLEPGNALSFTRWWRDGAAPAAQTCA